MFAKGGALTNETTRTHAFSNNSNVPDLFKYMIELTGFSHHMGASELFCNLISYLLGPILRSQPRMPISVISSSCVVIFTTV